VYILPFMSPAPRIRTQVLRNCTCFNLRKASRAVTQLYDEFLRPSNLRATQFSLIALLLHMGPLAITELAEAAVMDRTTLKRNLELLEREGLVRIRPSSRDARIREVSVTQLASSRLATALPLWEEAQAHVLSRLGAGRVQRLISDLSATVAAAHAVA
jgi:DNA-binding MarR family transcriptional regulator